MCTALNSSNLAVVDASSTESSAAPTLTLRPRRTVRRNGLARFTRAQLGGVGIAEVIVLLSVVLVGAMGLIAGYKWIQGEGNDQMTQFNGAVDQGEEDAGGWWD